MATIIGDNGNNALSGTIGADDIKGLGGDDTLLGGAGNDTLRGGSGADSLAGEEGADRLDGDQGNDALDGGNGNDTLNGGSGNDSLSGGQGNDRLDGDQGDDVIDTGAGDNTVNAGSGDDTVTAGNGNDRIDGDQGDDLIDAGEGKDTVTGGSGDDALSGGGGADSLEGNQGDDTLDGGAGADFMAGDSGDDTYFVDDLGDLVVEKKGQGKADHVFSAISYTLPANVENLTLVDVTGETCYVTNFEGFTTGASINGQDGWGKSGAYDESVVDDGGNTVWRISNAVTSGSFGDQPFAPRPAGFSFDPTVDPINSMPGVFAGEGSTGAAFDRFVTEFDFKSATGAAQAGLRITISPDNGQGGRQAFAAIADTGSGFDVTTFDVDSGGNFVGPITIASGLSYADYHTLAIEVLFNDGPDNDVANYYVDGSLVHTDTSWEQFYSNFQPLLHPFGVPVQTTLFRASGTAAPGTLGAGFYIDDFSYCLGPAVAPLDGTGNALDNVIIGNGGDNHLAGLGGDDTINGGNGDDTLNGGDADDALDGGDGIDCAEFAGSLDGYLITASGGIVTVTDIDPGNGDEGSDTLENIECLKFADITIDSFFTPASADAVIADYDPCEGDQLVFTGGLDPADLTISYQYSGNLVTATVLDFGLAGPMITLLDIYIPTFDQGFEANDDGWLDEENTGGTFEGHVTRVASGTGGIASSSGGFHAIFEQSDVGFGDFGPFTRFDGYSADFHCDWTASVDIYLDTGWAAGEGFDYSVAATGSDGLHRRDFIFHVTQDTSTGELLVAGSNNTNFDPREDLETINHEVITTSGWYRFEHHFRDDGGVLAVDLNLYDDLGNLLFTETRSDPSDTIPAVVGQNRYGWFTNIDVAGGIAVDNTTINLDETGFVFA